MMFIKVKQISIDLLVTISDGFTIYFIDYGLNNKTNNWCCFYMLSRSKDNL